MTKVLVCWEDRLHGKLDVCLRRALRHLGLPSPELFFDDCRGNGGFVPYIERDWPCLVQRGLPKSGGPIDYLVCVADADRAHECAKVPSHATEPASTAAWVARADEAWTVALRGAATLASDRIVGRFLRWNQESLLIAAHDVEGVLSLLGCRDRAAVTRHLRSCKPVSPLDTPDDLFVDHHRKSARCLDDLLKAVSAPPFKKGGQAGEDALDIASTRAIDRLCARVPDLATLARCVSAPPAAAAS